MGFLGMVFWGNAEIFILAWFEIDTSDIVSISYVRYDISHEVLLVEKSDAICNSSILGMQEFNPGFKDVGDFHWFAAQKTWVLWILLGHCQAKVM